MGAALRELDGPIIDIDVGAHAFARADGLESETRPPDLGAPPGPIGDLALELAEIHAVALGRSRMLVPRRYRWVSPLRPDDEASLHETLLAERARAQARLSDELLEAEAAPEAPPILAWDEHATAGGFRIEAGLVKHLAVLRSARESGVAGVTKHPYGVLGFLVGAAAGLAPISQSATIDAAGVRAGPLSLSLDRCLGFVLELTLSNERTAPACAKPSRILCVDSSGGTLVFWDELACAFAVARLNHLLRETRGDARETHGSAYRD